ncbi:hypothetical protein Fmac_026506 [Flemingia macrophylla]|uniref:Ribosomal protein L32 n=1 Tax=Flemingia macrophylla TaxID=520843 RepID=A0ABD1LF81_9FABA
MARPKNISKSSRTSKCMFGKAANETQLTFPFFQSNTHNFLKFYIEKRNL